MVDALHYSKYYTLILALMTANSAKIAIIAKNKE